MSDIKYLIYESALNSDNNIKRYNIENYIESVQGILNNDVHINKAGANFNTSVVLLSKALESFSNITIDKKVVNSFTSEYANNFRGVTARYLNTEDTTVFKPQYLNQYVQLVQDTIGKMMSGSIDSIEAGKFASNDVTYKIKKQIVRTSLPYDGVTKNIVSSTPVNEVEITPDYVKTKVIPFVTGFDKIKHETIAEMQAVISAIKEAEDSMRAMAVALKNSNDKIDDTTVKSKVNVVAYNGLNGLHDIISFVAAMAVRKLDVISGNVVTCNTIYSKASSNFTEAASIMPVDSNSLSEDLVKGKAGAYEILANNIYGLYANMFNVNALDTQDKNEELQQHNYDKSVYDNIAKSYIEISHGLDIIAREGGDYLLVFKDIIKKSGLELNLAERFQNDINNINDLSKFDTPMLDLVGIRLDPISVLSILTEVKEYPKNMNTIANIVSDTYQKLMLLITRFESNNNAEFSDIETINELKIHLGSVKEQYSEITKTIATAFYKRLKTLGDILEKSNEPIKTDDVVPIDTDSRIDFAEMAYESIFDEREDLYKSLFKAIQESYYIHTTKNLRGLNVVVEDGEVPVDVATANPETAAPADAVSIVNENLEQYRNDAIGKYNTIYTKDKNKQNTWISSNQDELNNRSYSNIGLQIAPYQTISSDNILTDVNNVANNIAAITPEVLGSCETPSDLHAKVFASIQGYSDPDTMVDGFTNYYKNGSSESLLNVANSDLKNVVVNEMLPYVTNYYADGGYADQISNGMNSIIDNSKNVITNCNGLGEKASWLSDAAKKYTGVVMNVTRDRASDYMKVLNDLVPKNASGTPDIKDGGDVDAASTAQELPIADNNQGVPAEEPVQQEVPTEVPQEVPQTM